MGQAPDRNWTAEITRVAALDTALRALWAKFVNANPALRSPFFHLRFAEIAETIAPNAALAILRSGDEVIGFFPFQRRGSIVLPIAAPLNDYHGVIAKPGLTVSLNDLRQKLNAREIRVSCWVQPIEQAEQRESVGVTLDAGGYARWLEIATKANPKFFKDKARSKRNLEKDVGPLSFNTECRDPELLDRLIGLKRDQYARTRHHDVFACGWTGALLHALLRETGPEFGGRIAAKWAGDHLISIEYSLYAGTDYHFWFPAFEPAFARWSPGMLLTLETIRVGADEGFSHFDFGLAGAAYKKYFCNSALTVFEKSERQSNALFRAFTPDVARSHGATAGSELITSLSRRFATIEACETTLSGKLRAGVSAAHAGWSKLAQRVSN